jgi:hypothetical protein
MPQEVTGAAPTPAMNTLHADATEEGAFGQAFDQVSVDRAALDRASQEIKAKPLPDPGFDVPPERDFRLPDGTVVRVKPLPDPGFDVPPERDFRLPDGTLVHVKPLPDPGFDVPPE